MPSGSVLGSVGVCTMPGSLNLKADFKKPGMIRFRSVMITTTSAHLYAKLAGFTPLELNAKRRAQKEGCREQYEHPQYIPGRVVDR